MARPLICLSNSPGMEALMAKRSWSWMMAVPISLMLACTGGTGDGSSEDTVRVTLQGRYEKRPLSSSGFGSITTLPTRYCWAEVWRSGGSGPISYGNLGTDGTGWVDIPRGINFYVIVRADITVPNTSANGFFMHGSVKQGTLQASYTSGTAFNQVQTWYMQSLTQVANGDMILPLLARENPTNADGDAGPFAIVDQMATFAEKTRALEPTLRMPDLHAFWNVGNTSTAYPTAALDPQNNVLQQPATTPATEPAPGDSRAIYQHKIRYASPTAPDRGADAYNDSLLQETFARLFFSSGIIRSDNDASAYISPTIPSESTIAFASGFGNFLSCAYRDNANLYDLSSTGIPTTWRLDQHQAPTTGGEFQGNAIARSLWGIYRNGSVFTNSQVGLQTIWNATIPSVANQTFEYGNASLGCYPTYLVGLTRLAGTQGGPAAANALRSELALENIGNGYDVTVPAGPYYSTSALWISTSSLPFTPTGTLKTYDTSTYGVIAYDRDQAQSYRFYYDGQPRTITLTTASPGLLVELMDAQGYLTYAMAPGAQNTITLTGRPSGYYAARVRIDPYVTYTGADATYTLSIQ